MLVKVIIHPSTSDVMETLVDWGEVKMDLWVCIFCGKKVQIDPPNCYLYDEGVVCVECHCQQAKEDEEAPLPC